MVRLGQVCLTTEISRWPLFRVESDRGADSHRSRGRVDNTDNLSHHYLCLGVSRLLDLVLVSPCQASSAQTGIRYIRAGQVSGAVIVISHQMYKEFISPSLLFVHPLQQKNCPISILLQSPLYISPLWLSVPRLVSDRDRNFTILTTIDRNIYIQR